MLIGERQAIGNWKLNEEPDLTNCEHKNRHYAQRLISHPEGRGGYVNLMCDDCGRNLGFKWMGFTGAGNGITHRDSGTN